MASDLPEEENSGVEVECTKPEEVFELRPEEPPENAEVEAFVLHPEEPEGSSTSSSQEAWHGVKVLQRDASSRSVPERDSQRSGPPDNSRIPLEQREQMYIAARARIFGENSNNQNANNSPMAAGLDKRADEDLRFAMHEGYISKGGDLLTSAMTLEEAKERASQMPDCLGFCFRASAMDSQILRSQAVVDVHFKNKWDFATSSSTQWLAFKKQESTTVPPDWAPRYNGQLKSPMHRTLPLTMSLENRTWCTQDRVHAITVELNGTDFRANDGETELAGSRQGNHLITGHLIKDGQPHGDFIFWPYGGSPPTMVAAPQDSSRTSQWPGIGETPSGGTPGVAATPCKPRKYVKNAKLLPPSAAAREEKASEAVTAASPSEQPEEAFNLLPEEPPATSTPEAFNLGPEEPSEEQRWQDSVSKGSGEASNQGGAFYLDPEPQEPPQQEQSAWSAGAALNRAAAPYTSWSQARQGTLAQAGPQKSLNRRYVKNMKLDRSGAPVNATGGTGTETASMSSSGPHDDARVDACRGIPATSSRAVPQMGQPTGNQGHIPKVMVPGVAPGNHSAMGSRPQLPDSFRHAQQSQRGLPAWPLPAHPVTGAGPGSQDAMSCDSGGAWSPYTGHQWYGHPAEAYQDEHLAPGQKSKHHGWHSQPVERDKLAPQTVGRGLCLEAMAAQAIQRTAQSKADQLQATRTIRVSSVVGREFGAELSLQVGRAPLYVRKIFAGGLLAELNDSSPADPFVEEGDAIVSVNNRADVVGMITALNSESFLEIGVWSAKGPRPSQIPEEPPKQQEAEGPSTTAASAVVAAQTSPSASETPTAEQEPPTPAEPPLEAEPNKIDAPVGTTRFAVRIDVSGQKLGIGIDKVSLAVTNIGDGPVQAYNDGNPPRTIMEGDRFFEVNGREMTSASEFLDSAYKEPILKAIMERDDNNDKATDVDVPAVQ